MAGTWRHNAAGASTIRPGGPAEKAEHVFAQLRETWDRGEAVAAAEILGQNPEFAGNRSVVLNLALEEFCRRLDAGERVDRNAFCEQFPRFRFSLCRLLQVTGEAEEKEVLEEAPWPNAGEQFGRYRLLEQLGGGELARVYLAADAHLSDRRVVLKISSLDESEADTMARLEHPNIVPVHTTEYDRSTDLAAVVMPFLGRATLCDILDFVFEYGAPPNKAAVILDAIHAANLEDGLERLPANDVLQQGSYVDGATWVAAQLAEALAFTHRRSVLHRDLKPSNVLLTPDGRPLLLDFNLALQGDTVPRRAGGTVPYMSPEQIRAAILNRAAQHVVDQQSDVFSLGVVTYLLLCGKHPFGTIDAEATPEQGKLLLERQQTGPLPVRSINPDVSPRLATLIESMLAFEPKLRPKSAAIVAEELQQCLNAPSPPPPAWHVRNRRQLLVATTVGLVAFSSLAGLFALSGPTEVHEYSLGVDAYRRSEYLAAVEHFTRVLERKPGDYAARLARARANFWRHNMPEAMMDLDRADPHDKDGPCVAATAWCYAKDEDYGPAEQMSLRAIELGFENAAVYNNLGFCVRKNQLRLEEAEGHLTKAIELNPQHGTAYFNRAFARLLRNARNPSVPLAEAQSDIERAVSLNAASVKMLRETADLASPAGNSNPIAREVATFCRAQAERLEGLRPTRPVPSWIVDPLPPL